MRRPPPNGPFVHAPPVLAGPPRGDSSALGHLFGAPLLRGAVVDDRHNVLMAVKGLKGALGGQPWERSDSEFVFALCSFVILSERSARSELVNFW
jgi:hypothetical protein